MMKTPQRANSIGWRELLGAGIALLLVAGSIVGAWSIKVVMTLIVLAIVYSVLRDVKALWRIQAEPEPTQSHGAMIPLRNASPGQLAAAVMSSDLGGHNRMNLLTGSAERANPTPRNAERKNA